MSINIMPFGKPDGEHDARLYVLTNDNGFSCTFSDYGATTVSIMAPDKEGKFADVVCGFDEPSYYHIMGAYIGATVGRFANRIAKGVFYLNGEKYDKLQHNDGNNHIHGGEPGLANRMWKVADIKDGKNPEITFEIFSPDGQDGYPGNLTVDVTFTVSENNEFKIHYIAKTDKATPVNLTNHSYFNLGGFNSGSAMKQIVWIDAESYVKTDDELIPTGEFKAVDGTPFDFRTPKALDRDIGKDDEDLKLGHGYDHCLNFTDWKNQGSEIKLRASAFDEKSGRFMEVYTNQPCVQLYTANFLNEPNPLKGGCPQNVRHAFCLETQKMPDSINQKGFTDVILKPEEVYDYTTIYAFKTGKRGM